MNCSSLPESKCTHTSRRRRCTRLLQRNHEGRRGRRNAVFITVNGQAVVQTTCSPTLLEAFAAGRLLAEGYVHERDDLRSIIVEGNDNQRTIKVELPLPASQAGEGERRHRAQHACGILYYLECAPETLRRPCPAKRLMWCFSETV